MSFLLFALAACQSVAEAEHYRIECQTDDPRQTSSEVFSEVFASDSSLKQAGCRAPQPHLLGNIVYTPSCSLADTHFRALLADVCLGELLIKPIPEQEFRETQIVDYLD